MCKIISISNQKGGVGKSTTAINLSVALAKNGYKVLALDLDPQGNFSMSLGYHNPDEFKITISNLIQNEIENNTNLSHSKILTESYILKKEGLDFIPSNTQLSGMEYALINAISRESIIKNILKPFRKSYDYIIIDCPPSLNILTINALTASDEVIIPVQSQYLSAKGLELLLSTINMVKSKLNPDLKISGVLITMFDKRTNFQKDVVKIINETYGEHVNIFKNIIPMSVRVAETQSRGLSIYKHDPKGKVAQSYEGFANEFIERMGLLCLDLH